MRRLGSRKPNSWIWDSHISPINSKQLAENLEEMDQSVKRMLNVIKEDGVSFAKKAEIYFQKRPELEGHVEEFYRMYRALAEHCDNLTGELRNSLPTDLRSQGSGISDGGCELRYQLESAKKGIEMMEAELKLEKKYILDLEEQITRLEVDAQDNFPLEKSQLLEKISLALESQARLEEELKSLEEDVKRVETKKTENKHLQAIHEAGMQREIEQLKADIARRSNQLELTNKNFDTLELKYDMLVAQRDQLNAMVLTLTAEVSSRDDRIRQMDEHLHRLHLEQTSGSERASKLVEELKARSKTLEEEVVAQKIVILEGAEEKREAIRQLCFALEHYREGYHRLRQAFLLRMRPVILAS